MIGPIIPQKGSPGSAIVTRTEKRSKPMFVVHSRPKRATMVGPSVSAKTVHRQEKNTFKGRSSALTTAPDLPSEVALKRPGAISQLIASAADMRRVAIRKSNYSRYVELTRCAHAALYLHSQAAAWRQFCVEKKLSKPYSTLKAILREVLRLYVGTAEDDKAVSYYTRALYQTLADGKSALGLFELLTKHGGVEALLQSYASRPPKSRRSAAVKLPRILIKVDGEYTLRLPKGTQQAVIFRANQTTAEPGPHVRSRSQVSRQMPKIAIHCPLMSVDPYQPPMPMPESQPLTDSESTSPATF
jgi:hypothetical protein